MDTETHKKYLVQVGSVCSQWSFLEYVITHAIWHMLKLDKKTGTIITGGRDIKPQVDMALELAAHMNLNEDIQEILRFAKREIERLAPQRNNIVHGVFSINDTSIAMVENPRRKSTRERKDITPEDIQEIGFDIYHVAKKVEAVFEKYGINID